MSQAFIIVLREGFEAFLIVSVIVSYLKKTDQTWLLPAAYWGIAASLLLSVVLGFVMSRGVNEPLWEGILGLVAAVMVTTLVIQLWRQGRYLKQNMEKRLDLIASKTSKQLVISGVFLFTAIMITREGMETALMLIQVPQRHVIGGALLGIFATAGFAWLWVRYSQRINLQLFFQVTGVYLLLFVAQILIYSFHEFSETGLIPDSEAFHSATEPFSPEGIYGKWFPVVMIVACAAWLILAWVVDCFKQKVANSSD